MHVSPSPPSNSREHSVSEFPAVFFIRARVPSFILYHYIQRDTSPLSRFHLRALDRWHEKDREIGTTPRSFRAAASRFFKPRVPCVHRSCRRYHVSIYAVAPIECLNGVVTCARIRNLQERKSRVGFVVACMQCDWGLMRCCEFGLTVTVIGIF